MAKESIKNLEGELEKQSESHREMIKSMQSRIDEIQHANFQLERELTRLQDQGRDDLKASDDVKLQLNHLLLRATKEISHVDRVNEDLDVSCRALNDETSKLKQEKEYLREQMAELQGKYDGDKERLDFEIASLTKNNAELDETISGMKIRVTDLEDELRNSRQVIFFCSLRMGSCSNAIFDVSELYSQRIDASESYKTLRCAAASSCPMAPIFPSETPL